MEPDEFALRVPPEHADLHDETLFGSAWQRMVAWFREPVRAWADEAGTRHLHILGAGVYSVKADGQLDVWLWQGLEQGSSKLELDRRGAVSVDPLPFGWLWFEQWGRGFRIEVQRSARRRGLTCDDGTVAAYVEWVFVLFRQRIRRQCDMRWVRSRIARAVKLDPVALRVARRINLLLRRSSVTQFVYNVVRANMEVHRKLLKDAPRLDVMFQLLSNLDGFPAAGEPLQRMRSFLLASGLSPRAWRMVTKAGGRLLAPVGSYYTGTAWTAVLDYLLLIDAMGWRAEPRAEFIEVVLGLRGHPTDRPKTYRNRFGPLMPQIKRIVQEFEHGDADRQAAILKDLHPALDYLDLAGTGRGDRPSATLKWAALVLRARNWAGQRLMAEQHGSEGWPVPAKLLKIDDHQVKFIDNAISLHEEARAMRHCAFDFAADCRTGVRAVASVRDARDRRVATALWQRSDAGWHLDQVSGFANAAVAARVVRMLAQLHLGAEEGQRA